MPKNVLQFIGSFHQGGSERQGVQLTNLLNKDENFNVFVATLEKKGVLLEDIKEFDTKKIPEYKLNSFFSLHFFKQIRRCAKFLRENQIDIVHTHDFYTNIFGILAARYARIPVKIASKRETGGMRSTNQNRIEKYIFNTSSAITVNAKAVKNYLKKRGINSKKIEVIYNGLDLERLKPKEKNREKICEQLGLPNEKDIKFITLVANLRHSVKNQPMLLRAAQRLVKDFPNTHFVFAGEGERKNYLENMAKRLEVSENTHFIDRCRIVPELLSISYACVLTSTAEGFSNSILEYMSASKPVVATDVGGAREAIKDGKTGYLVESNDDEAMARCLKVLIKNPAKAVEMGFKGKEQVRKKFSSSTQLNDIIRLYNKLLS